MSEDFSDFRRYLMELRADIYAQPPDAGHLANCEAVLAKWLPMITTDLPKEVLDVGCGQGFAREMFETLQWKWRGLTIGPDYKVCEALGLPVDAYDFTFTGYPDNSFTLLFARHSLEHSPCALLTLFELHRITRDGGLLIAIMPSPKFQEGDGGEVLEGQNHYSLLTANQWEAVALRAGWRAVWRDIKNDAHELRFLFERIKRPPVDIGEGGQ